MVSSNTVSTPQNDDFHVDLTFSGHEKNYARPIGIVVAAVSIVFIITTMATNVASHILPMSDEYMLALVPAAADGAEPLSLKTLDHEITEKTIVVRGTVANRTDYNVSNIVAFVEMLDTTGRFAQTVEVPVEPKDLPPQGTGNFTASATLQEKPSGYLLKFRLADGPFVPHKDDRAASFGITGK